MKHTAQKGREDLVLGNILLNVLGEVGKNLSGSSSDQEKSIIEHVEDLLTNSLKFVRRNQFDEVHKGADCSGSHFTSPSGSWRREEKMLIREESVMSFPRALEILAKFWEREVLTFQALSLVILIKIGIM